MAAQTQLVLTVLMCVLGCQLIIYFVWNNSSPTELKSESFLERKLDKTDNFQCPPLAIEKEQQIPSSTDPRDYMKFWNMHSDLKNYWLRFKSFANKKTFSKPELDSIDEGYVVLNDRIENVLSSSVLPRQRHIKKMKELIFKKIDELQNPKDCNKAQILICDNHVNCGFGCWLHQVINCFVIAFKEQRTLIYTQKQWRYAKTGFGFSFLPFTNCDIQKHTSDNSNQRVVQTTVSSGNFVTWISWSIPAQLSPTLQQIHAHPFAWWISQFTAYLMRYQPWLKEKIKKVMKKIKFEGPIAGIQVRRGDKLKAESKRYEVEEYMLYVEQWFNQQALTKPDLKRKVFVATEDSTVLPELMKKYPNYTFIESDLTKQTNMSADAFTAEINKKIRQSRYTEEGLQEVVIDIQLLAQCDFLACTLSSSVCRTAYELMTYSRGDVTTSFQSVDQWYRFKLSFNAPWYAVTHHNAEHDLAVEEGDRLNVSYRPHTDVNNGFLPAKNLRTMKSGKVPAYKIREQTLLIDYPILEDIREELNTMD